jgi:hypothetical protein
MQRTTGTIFVLAVLGSMLLPIAREGIAMLEAACTAGRRFSFELATAAPFIADVQDEFVADEGGCGGGEVDLKPLQAGAPHVWAVLEAERGLTMTIICTRYGFKADLSNLPQSVSNRAAIRAANTVPPVPWAAFLQRAKRVFGYCPS